MYEGEVVQLGTPQDLFERPAHRFVGYFIGSPGMNFLRLPPGRRGRSGSRAPMRCWARIGTRPRASCPNARLELGIRPEFVGVTREADGTTLPAKIERVEDLGNYKLVTARLGPHAVKAKLAEERARSRPRRPI